MEVNLNFLPFTSCASIAITKGGPHDAHARPPLTVASRCLRDQESECPNCARAHGLIKEIKGENDVFAQHPEMFLANVKDTGFDAIAEGFSKGLLGPKTEVVSL